MSSLDTDFAARARVLVTGAGGAAGIAVIRALDEVVGDLHAGDCDRLATGLHLVAPDRRILLPRGDDPWFAEHLASICVDRAINVVIPTVDEELIAVARAREALERHGIIALCPSTQALETCLDKHALMETLSHVAVAPQSALLDEHFEPGAWEFPVAVKPRTGRGGRGFCVVDDAAGLDRMPHDGSLLVQEYLPGAEYSVDVLVCSDGHVAAAVPRDRLRVDSGVAVVACSLHDELLEDAAGECAREVGLRGPANVQLRRDRAGAPKLLEINPRFPGTVALTIASGVDLPLLALADAMGEPIPEDAGTFEPVGIVRMLAETVVPVAELVDGVPPRAGRAAPSLHT
jgi:carbamoyl-phosphate synthase large subunit